MVRLRACTILPNNLHSVHSSQGRQFTTSYYSSSGYLTPFLSSGAQQQVAGLVKECHELPVVSAGNGSWVLCKKCACCQPHPTLPLHTGPSLQAHIPFFLYIFVLSFEEIKYRSGHGCGNGGGSGLWDDRTSTGHHFIFQIHLPTPAMSRLKNPAPNFLTPASHLAGWLVCWLYSQLAGSPTSPASVPQSINAGEKPLLSPDLLISSLLPSETLPSSRHCHKEPELVLSTPYRDRTLS